MKGLPTLLLTLLLGQGWSAPRTAQDSRSELLGTGRIINPFLSGSEHLRLLQGYLKESDPYKDNVETLRRKTVILHLVVLHDYDKSGSLDGLELMQLLRGILSQTSERNPPSEEVILLVDEVLDKQDLNKDGLLSGSELVTPPVYVSESEEETSPNTVNIVIPSPLGDLKDDKPKSLETEEMERVDVKTMDHPPLDPLSQVNEPEPEVAKSSQEEPPPEHDENLKAPNTKSDGEISEDEEDIIEANVHLKE